MNEVKAFPFFFFFLKSDIWCYEIGEHTVRCLLGYDALFFLGGGVGEGKWRSYGGNHNVQHHTTRMYQSIVAIVTCCGKLSQNIPSQYIKFAL